MTYSLWPSAASEVGRLFLPDTTVGEEKVAGGVSGQVEGMRESENKDS
jgi:hypothetical protein